MFFFDPVYLILLVFMIGLSGWAAWRVRSTYARWSTVDSGIDLNPYDFARRLLDRQGLTSVRIEPTPGQLTDHYDPRAKVLRVSQSVAAVPALSGGRAPQLSVAAAAVIAHEVGTPSRIDRATPGSRPDRSSCPPRTSVRRWPRG